MEPIRLTLGHSPDPDDAFMFYALARNLIPTHGLEFEHRLEDIQTLNERARRGELDITAISVHAYAFVRDQYALLASGASMGDGYGPLLVAKAPVTRAEIPNRRIAIPGTTTSAFLALQLWLEIPAEKINYMVVPFDQIFDTVNQGDADVGLVIHEGQLTYEREGLVACRDLGQWWQQTQDGLPLPLGANAIHKRHPPERRQAIARILRHSIEYSLNHREEAVAYALQFARDMERPLADRFVGMYVNDWTLDYGERGMESIRRFFALASEKALLPPQDEPEFVS